MSRKKENSMLTPAEIKKLAKKIISENPTFVPDEPIMVGSPENFTEEKEGDESEQSTAKKPERSKK